MSRRHAALWTLLLLLLAASAAMQVLAADAGDKNWLLLTARLSTTIDTCQNLHTPVKWECRFDIYSRNSSGEPPNVPQR